MSFAHFLRFRNTVGSVKKNHNTNFFRLAHFCTFWYQSLRILTEKVWWRCFSIAALLLQISCCILAPLFSCLLLSSFRSSLPPPLSSNTNFFFEVRQCQCGTNAKVVRSFLDRVTPSPLHVFPGDAASGSGRWALAARTTMSANKYQSKDTEKFRVRSMS